MKVLIIDDDRNVRRAIAACFFGMEMSEAGTLAEALARMVETKFDLIIADLILPDSDSMTAISQIRKSDVDAVLVAITGMPAEDGVEKHADGLILKPLRGCPDLCAQIMGFVEQARREPRYASAIKAISAWAQTYGSDPQPKKPFTGTHGVLARRPRPVGSQHQPLVA